MKLWSLLTPDRGYQAVLWFSLSSHPHPQISLSLRLLLLEAEINTNVQSAKLTRFIGLIPNTDILNFPQAF